MFSLQEIAQFKRICSSFGMELSFGRIKKFQEYASLLLEWNKRIHLVSKKDASTDRIIRHFVDSLSIFKVIDIPIDANLLDIGSGAGFPAIPIKIFREDVKLTLVESIHKKALFVQKLLEVLKLKEVAILNQRAEKLFEEKNLTGNFDLVTAKALGNLERIRQIGMPFLKARGLLVAYKGRGIKEEIENINVSKESRIEDIVKIEIPEIKLLRWLVLIRK